MLQYYNNVSNFCSLKLKKVVFLNKFTNLSFYHESSIVMKTNCFSHFFSEPVLVTPNSPGPTCYCGCTLTTEEGSIQSNPLFCENRNLFKWVIIAPDNHSIHLEFVSFYLAIHREYLRVRDGEDGDSPLLAYHTGVALPGPVSTSGNTMYIEYRVVRGGNLDQMGFSAVFNSQGECMRREH